MLLVGADWLRSHVAAAAAGGAGAAAWSAKMVFNARGAVFFPVSREHRDMKAEGISYEDNYRGNALAAMLGPGRVEVRWHRAFADREVARIARSLLAREELAFLVGARVTYQGREVVPQGGG